MFQLEKAKEEIVVLKKKCEDCDQEITRLKSDLKRMSGDYGKIATRSRIVSWKTVVCMRGGDWILSKLCCFTIFIKYKNEYS